MNSQTNNKSKKPLISILMWIGLGLIMGLSCGLVGAAFSHSVIFVTSLFGAHKWIIFLLPVGGIISVIIYKLFNVTHLGTDDAVEAAHSEKKVSPKLTPAVFICSVITHLCGGSAGREGAALKMGGGIASFFSGAFKLSERERRTLALCGMSGVFAAVFGAPIGAAIFTIEVVRSSYIKPWAILTALISSFSAFGVSLLLFVKPERFHIPEIPAISADSLMKVLGIGAICGIISLVFCYAMHYTPVLAKKIFKNDFLRIVVLSVIIVVLTIVIGTRDYNGGGIGIIEGIFEGHNASNEAFAMKIVFTALTVAAGFKGGEIVPGFFVGATAGSLIATLMGVSPAFGAAIGMVALFAGITNCPIATLFLGMEMFGTGAVLYFFIAITISFLLSGKLCLYDIEKYPFKQLKKELAEKNKSI